MAISKRSKQFEKWIWIKKFEVFGQIALLLRYPTSCLLPVEKSLVCDNQYDAVAIFVSQAKMQLRQGNENQSSLNLIWGCDIMLWGQNEYVWGQRSILGHVWPLIVSWPLTSYPNLCIFIVTSEGSTCPLTMVSHPKLISKLFWFSLTWHNCIFAWLTKIATESLLIVTH